MSAGTPRAAAIAATSGSACVGGDSEARRPILRGERGAHGGVGGRAEKVGVGAQSVAAGEAQPAQHPQRIVGERLEGRQRRPQQPVLHVREPAHVILHGLRVQVVVPAEMQNFNSVVQQG